MPFCCSARGPTCTAEPLGTYVNTARLTVAPSTLTSREERLTSSLFEVYHAYKSATACLIDWLQSQDDPKGQKLGANDSTKVTLCIIIAAARKAATKSIRPPGPIHDAFKVALVNRNKLTRYYKSFPVRTKLTEESTERHTAFNAILAEAYNLLFP